MPQPQGTKPAVRPTPLIPAEFIDLSSISNALLLGLLARPEVIQFLSEQLKILQGKEEGKDPNALLTPKKVGALIGIQQRRVYEAIKAGELPAQQHACRGGRLGSLVKRQDAKAWGRTVRHE